MKEYLRHHWVEWVIVFGLAIASLGVYLAFRFLPKEAGETALVFRNQQKLLELSLFQDGDYPIDGEHGPMTLHIENGGICVSFSSCPGQDCVHQGYIRQAGQPIVCAHNHVAIYVEGKAASEIIVG